MNTFHPDKDTPIPTPEGVDLVMLADEVSRFIHRHTGKNLDSIASGTLKSNFPGTAKGRVAYKMARIIEELNDMKEILS